jgi:hypothetical protein
MPSKIPEWRQLHKIQGVSHANGHVNFVSNYVLQWRVADGGGRPPRETAGRRPPRRILAKELKGKLNASKIPRWTTRHKVQGPQTGGRWWTSFTARNRGTATAAQDPKAAP